MLGEAQSPTDSVVAFVPSTGVRCPVVPRAPQVVDVARRSRPIR